MALGAVHASHSKVVAHSLGRDEVFVANAAAVCVVAVFGCHGSNSTFVYTWWYGAYVGGTIDWPEDLRAN